MNSGRLTVAKRSRWLPSVVLLLAILFFPAVMLAESALLIRNLAERKVTELPGGDLYWRIEKFSSKADATVAAGQWSLVAESYDAVWLFTLGPKTGPTSKGIKIAEVGPIPRVIAKEYLLRINAASGQPGSTTPIHSHPGSEAYFVLRGIQTIRSPRGLRSVAAGTGEPGNGVNIPMQVSSSGTEELQALVMFVLDATKPFSSPECFPAQN
ncbi:MAG TPA: hypothetical protein VGM64_09665 [Lacunisphaera sp.]|jgi:hypothetical protein